MLVARSSAECHLYMELHPCRCGEYRLAGEHAVESRGDDLVAVYLGPCANCGADRSFAFVLDPELPPGRAFGGATPSRILCPGQFLRVADEAASGVPVNTSRMGPQERQRARWLLSRAVMAMEEVLKFIPVGDDRVPPAAFTSADGKASYAREPGRFRKARLEAVLGAYREGLTGLG